MAEHFDQAAWRHYRSAEVLLRAECIDDAGYHFGMAGENAIKNALRSAGLERLWTDTAVAKGERPERYLKDTPMRGHLPDLGKLVKKARVEISLYAVGRVAGNINAIMLDPAFEDRFSGWNLNIRYADPIHCPVGRCDCERWEGDAADLLLALVL